MSRSRPCVLVALACLCAAGSANAASPPTLVAAPTSVSFGEVPLGGLTVPQPVTITNDRASSASLNQVTITGADSSVFGIGADNCSGALLASGQSCTIDVSADSSQPGAVAAQLDVSWGSPAASLTVPLSATFLNPARAIWTPASLAFGAQAVGTASAPETVTLSDAAGSEFFDAETLSQGGDADQFTILADNCSNTVVDPSTSCTVEIAFTPTTSGDKTATLTPFCMCGVGNSRFYTDLPLSGTGARPTPPPPTPAPRISKISLSSSTIRWCKGCAAPKTALRFRLTRAALVRVSLGVRAHRRWRQAATSTFHGHAGLNRDRIAGRWHGRLREAGQVRLLVQLKHGRAWKTHRSLQLTVQRSRGRPGRRA